MPQPDHVSALPIGDPAKLDDDLKAAYAQCIEKLGIVPNVLRAYSLRPQKLRNFIAMYNELMLAPSGLSKLEREMVAVVVSTRQPLLLLPRRARSGGAQAVRRSRARRDAGDELSRRPARSAPARHARFRLEADDGAARCRRGRPRRAARASGLGDEDIFDLAETVAFFNMSNRMA